MKSYPVTLTVSETGETIQKKFELGEGETNVEQLLDAVRAARLCPLGNNLRLVNQEKVTKSLHKLGDNDKISPKLGPVVLVRNEDDGEWDLCTIHGPHILPNSSSPAFEHPLNAYHQAEGVEVETKTEISYLDFVAGGKKTRFVLPSPNYDAESHDEDTPEIFYEKGVDIIHLDTHHPTIDDLKDKVRKR